MKQYYISMLVTDDEIQEFFMVKSLEIKTGANGKEYLDIFLGDKTGEAPSKKWDIAEAEAEKLKEIAPGDIVKVKALVTSWNGQRQMKISRIRKVEGSDDIDFSDYIKAAPFDPEEMYEEIYTKAAAMKDKELSALCTLVMERNKEKLMYYPAAQKNHHAQRSGLLYHLKRMVRTGEAMAGIYVGLNIDLLLTGIILHDMEKLNEIEADTQGIATGYSYEGQMLGHIIQGIKSVDKLGEEIGMSREKTIMVQHMILSHHYEPEFGSPKKPLFPEAEMLHYIDIIDARMFDMEDALEKTMPGQFSDRIWTLDNRKLYKPESGNE